MASRKRKEKDPLARMSAEDIEAIRSWVRLHEDKPELEVVRALARLWNEWLAKVPKHSVHVSDHNKARRESESLQKALRRIEKANAELMDKSIVLKRDLAMTKRALAAAQKFNEKLERARQKEGKGNAVTSNP